MDAVFARWGDTFDASNSLSVSLLRCQSKANKTQLGLVQRSKIRLTSHANSRKTNDSMTTDSSRGSIRMVQGCPNVTRPTVPDKTNDGVSSGEASQAAAAAGCTNVQGSGPALLRSSLLSIDWSKKRQFRLAERYPPVDAVIL